MTEGHTILILDDDPGIARLVGNSVAAMSCKPVTFSNGVDALSWIASNKPDLMLLDNVLPDMRATDFLDAAEKSGISAPFIMTTGQGSEAVAVELMKRGALDYVVKDADFLERLPAVLKRALTLIAAQRKVSDMEKALAQYRVETRAILEAAADGIATFDDTGRIVTANSAIREMYGLQGEELVGQNVSVLFAHKAVGATLPLPGRQTTSEVKRQLRAPHEFIAVRTDGSSFDAEVTFSEIEGSSQRLYLAIVRDISDKKRVQRQMLHDAFHDKLTGLPNRAHAVHQIAQALSRNLDDPATSCAVLFIDLDRFKVVNDSLGHGAGDLLLMEVARRLTHVAKQEYSLARINSDEFVIVIRSTRDLLDATHMAQSVLEALVPDIPVRGANLKAGASIGIAISQPGETDAEDLLRRADLAMNRAKENGRGRYEVFQSEMHSRTALMMRLEIELRRALGTDEIVNYYQPVVDITKGKLAGFEALVRWKQPGKRMVPPSEFIPLAEETGMISALGRQVLHNALRQVRDWRDRLGITTSVSVNLSARQLRSDDVVSLVADALKQHEVPASCLRLELTESAFIDYNRGDLGALDELKRMGVGMAIDDFGTGYSSFGYLGKLPIETIKTDRSFIQDLPDGAQNVAIITAILALARAMKKSVVIEGVEHKGQLKFLLDHGCRWVQGFFFSPPVPADQAEPMLTKVFEIEV